MKILLALCFIAASVSAQMIAETVIANNCSEVIEMTPRNDTIFESSFDRNLDYKHLGGRVIAYKIQWFNGNWSRWFVPDFNDVDWKYTAAPPKDGSKVSVPLLRRVWSYFGNHNYSYVICKWSSRRSFC